ncbi:type II secretion system protein [Opitutus sp. ER46]|uniref:type II secretion system protein n=1 Tax=Opitutus sp. ER46 TaxID=2161864 RepID=UPI000D2FD771|nr:type II secretion system protein [Opitutus sp. ER46]PTX91386.1 hypothetical protein DB354_15945 [Opitutus sp. ER46]
MISDLAPSPVLSSSCRRQAGFTLTEVLVATSILGLAISMTMVVYVAAMKRAHHTEFGLKGTAELRYATDVISQAVRSASQLPTVESGGLKLLVPPKDIGYATVEDITWIDDAKTIKGTKSDQKVLKLSDLTLPAVVVSAWKSAARPAGAITNTDVATYFKAASEMPTTDLNSIFAVGDTITIPATAFGIATQRVINSISNSKGNKTLTLTAKLGVSVPSGTRINATSGRRMMFEVVSAEGKNQGELRYYPDSKNTAQYTVLARDIDFSPLSEPANVSSTATVPFVIPTDAKNYVIINLQKVPGGSGSGRTLQGVQTTVYTRTDPTNQ